jgi:outer membrane protein
LNPIRLFVFLGGLVASTISYTPFSHAQSQNAEDFLATVAVLDLVVVRREALAIKDVHSQISGFQKTFGASVQKEEEALKVANQELAKKRSILAPEAFAEERRNFEQKVVAVQRSVQERKRALDKVRADALLKIDAVLNNIVKDIATANNINLVLRRELLILSSRAMDITGQALEKLNAQLPKVKVEKPGK